MTDVSVGFRPPCWCPSGWAPTWRPIQISINLDDTLLRIARELNTAETWFLARLFILQSSIISQILEFIYRTVVIFFFDHMTDENRELLKWPVWKSCQNSPFNLPQFFFRPTCSWNDSSSPENSLVVWSHVPECFIEPWISAKSSVGELCREA